MPNILAKASCKKKGGERGKAKGDTKGLDATNGGQQNSTRGTNLGGKPDRT
jgi:hypothetical protein